jgi:hypothetical protein
VKPLSIGVAIGAAIALLAGLTKGGVDVLGLAADPTLLSIGAVGLMLAVGRTLKLLTFTTTYFQANVVIPYIIATAYRDEAGSGWYIRADADNSGGILGRRAAMNFR